MFASWSLSVCIVVIPHSQFLICLPRAYLPCTHFSLLPSVTLLPPRLQRRGDGGRPWQAAGVLRDLVRLVSHNALTWPGEWRRHQQQCRRFGPSGGGAAQRRAGRSQAVGPCRDHSAGHPQHSLWEVRPNSDIHRIWIDRIWSYSLSYTQSQGHTM